MSGRWLATVFFLFLTPMVLAGQYHSLKWRFPQSEKQPNNSGERQPPEPLSAPGPEVGNPPLTLDDLVHIACVNNPTLRAAAARVSAARGKQVQAGLYPNPVIGYSGQEMGNLDTGGKQGGFVGQRIITGGKLRLDRSITGKEVDEAHCLLHAQEQRVLSDVLRADRADLARQVDLLTVVEHELGHALGLDDLDSTIDGLMNPILQTGMRRNAGHREIDDLFADGDVLEKIFARN